MTLSVEPTKPRLCNDNRFLNLWVKYTPFSLDSIKALPRYVSPSSFQSVCDDKSGHDHVFLSFPPLVAPILAFNGPAGILWVTLSLSGGNPLP